MQMKNIEQIGERTGESYLERAKTAAAHLQKEIEVREKRETIEKRTHDKNVLINPSAEGNGALVLGLGLNRYNKWYGEILLLVPGAEPVKIAERFDWVRALYLDKGELIDIGDYQEAYRTWDEHIVARPVVQEGLCLHKGKEYARHQNKIYRPIDNRMIAEREKSVLALCSHNGLLYDAGCYSAIYETRTNKIVYDFKRNVTVTALCSIDEELYQKLLPLGDKFR